MKVKVLHFLGSGEIGGQEKSIYYLMKTFANDSEYKVAVAMGKNRGPYAGKIGELNIESVNLNLKSGFSIKLEKKVISKLREYQVHHFHDPSPIFIVYSLMAGFGIKRVLTRRGGYYNYNKKGIKSWLKYFINRTLINIFFQGFSGNTELASDFVRYFYRIREKKIFTLYNGIFFDDLRPSFLKTHAQEKLNLSKTQFNIGTACHLVPWKRVDLIIRSFKKCAINGKKLIIFGKGKEEKKLRELAESLNLMEQITFVGEVKNLPDYLQVLDCFVLASGVEESFGNALIEAMYLKIPSIIMADSLALREHIEENVTGFVAKNELDLTNKIEFIFLNPGFSKSIAENASLYVSNKYSVGNMIKAYKEFYSSILNA